MGKTIEFDREERKTKVITYIAINLKTKKFQIGSTTDFERRYKGHMSSDMNPEFNRALQKDPESFLWLVSEDDGLNTRDVEQCLLDMYYGNPLCYNLNPNASQPPSQEGTFWWNNGEEQVKQRECPGEGWINGRLGSWWNDGENNKICLESPGEQWKPGMVFPLNFSKKLSKAGKGKVWWNNGTEEVRAKECPGEGWFPGRIYSAEGKVAWTDGVSNTFSGECPGPGWHRGLTLSEEQRYALGCSHRGKKYGKRDPSVGKKISEKLRGKSLTPEHVEALKAGRKNIPVNNCEICGKEIRGGKGNLNQHMRWHERRGDGSKI